jgi:hypothetical protein
MDGSMIPGHSFEWWTPGAPGPLATWILGSLGFAVAAWMVVRLSTGRDVPIAVAADEPFLAPAQHVVDAETTPAEAVAPEASPGTAPN